jgi:RHS repeat-associated protein
VREWSPYGEEIGGAQAGLGFPGEWFDAAVGMTYLRARWYDNRLGRFAQADVWEGEISTPQTLQRYGYGLANPINFVDPSGQMPQGEPQFFDRNRAAIYAWVYRNKPYESDGYVEFLKKNCTNFVSRVLWAGGLYDPRDPESSSVNDQLPYWYPDPARVATRDDNKSGTWAYTELLRNFLKTFVGAHETTYPSPPYFNSAVNRAGVNAAENERWYDFLVAHNVGVGDVVFYHQEDRDDPYAAYWGHAAFIIGWGEQTDFPATPRTNPLYYIIPFPMPDDCGKYQKPLVVEHSNPLNENHLEFNPKSIDNTGGKVDEISIVHIPTLLPRIRTR